MSSNQRRFLTLAAILLLGVLAAFFWRSRRALEPLAPDQTPYTLLSGHTMGGVWEVKIRELPPGLSASHCQTQAAALLDRLDAEMSLWEPNSDVCRFNRCAHANWFAVAPDVAQVVAFAQQVSAESGGAFDITVAPLVRLWGFGPDRLGVQLGQIPSDADIAAARAHVDYRLLSTRLDPPALKKTDAKLAIDLGAIAKGYAAEAVAKLLTSMGVRDYLVSVGGELRAAGIARNGQPWRVGIETPTADIRRIFLATYLVDASLSTSGDYRNFVDIKGRRYCHEIDPYTGRPVDSSLASLSVVHATGALADGWATALMVLGPDRALKLAREKHLAVFGILRKNDGFATFQTDDFPAESSSISRR